MSCCIIGKESLDDLEAMLISFQFADIVNKKLERTTWHQHPYGPDQLRRRIEVCLYLIQALMVSTPCAGGAGRGPSHVVHLFPDC
jgi:secreted Zn-dependent insulinase-like peptidase